MVTRHEFLASLHELLEPRRYFEIGVQYGHSLRLAKPSTLAIGVDPNRLCEPGPGQFIFTMTSRDYFNSQLPQPKDIDLAFIDGSHLIEDVIEDYNNVVRHSHERTVIVLDDVLPYTQEMTSREMVNGDWTGDAWKILSYVDHHYPWMNHALVDTFPTGLLVCWDVKRGRFHERGEPWQDPGPIVPQEILTRSDWVDSPEVALSFLRSWWEKGVPVSPATPL